MFPMTTGIVDLYHLDIYEQDVGDRVSDLEARVAYLEEKLYVVVAAAAAVAAATTGSAALHLVGWCSMKDAVGSKGVCCDVLEHACT